MQRLLVALASLSFVLTGCGPKDTDGDYLLDEFEIAIGTNPELADSDGDGFTDTVEYLQYFDPNDEDDFPYTGGYPRLPLPDSIDDDGWQEGDVTNDWDQDDSEDQYGEGVNIHKFYGNVVLLDIAAEWCGPCRDAAPGANDEYHDLKDQGFIVINILLDGLTQTEAPDPERWIEQLELDDSFPVVGDQDQSIAGNYITPNDDDSFGIPNFTIFDRELNIRARQINPIDWDLIDDLLDEDPPEIEWPLPENAEEIRAELGLTTLSVDYIVPGEGIPEAAGGASLDGSGGASPGDDNAGNGGADSSGGGDSASAPAEVVEPGVYAGPPFGGAGDGCSVAAGSSSAGLLSLAFLCAGALGLRRRR
jgi:thiol-disulfide isomerase/thioredoxin